MNPSSKETSGLNLTPPAGEQLAVASNSAEEGPSTPEKVPAAPEKQTGKAAPSGAGATTTTIPLPVLPDPGATSAQGDVSSTSKSTTKPLLQDTDLIEKEWVNKAKQIVEQTRDDPHRQSDELTVVKADYMKQRYNKTIKIDK